MTTETKFQKPKGRKLRLTPNQLNLLGKSIQIVWTVSRGRDTAGYNVVTLRDHTGARIARCNGGGYDMKGTVIGHWLTAMFPAELRALKEKQMPANSHWQPAHTRVCDGACKVAAEAAFEKDFAAVPDGVAHKMFGILHNKHALPRLAEDCYQCPKCGGATVSSRDGKTVDDGRYFYGLCFSDPKYNPLDAVLEKCDGTFTKPEDVGKTFRQLQKLGRIVDLDLIRKWYAATAKHATRRHTVPHVDGACGESSVRKILNAIGLDLKSVHSAKNLDVLEIVRHIPRA